MSPGFDVADDAEYVAQSTTLHDGMLLRRRQVLRLRRAMNQLLLLARQNLALLALGRCCPPGPMDAARAAALPSLGVKTPSLQSLISK